MSEKTYWNFEELKPPARRCLVTIEDAPEFAAYWARSAGLIGTTVSAVEVNYPGWENPAYLFDGDGSGWNKVTEGRGGPGSGHKNISGTLVRYKEEGEE